MVQCPWFYLVSNSILIKNLELQILVFELLSFGRLMIFSYNHTFFCDILGIASFGALTGISSLITAILGFACYPL